MTGSPFGGITPEKRGLMGRKRGTLMIPESGFSLKLGNLANEGVLARSDRVCLKNVLVFFLIARGILHIGHLAK